MNFPISEKKCEVGGTNTDFGEVSDIRRGFLRNPCCTPFVGENKKPETIAGQFLKVVAAEDSGYYDRSALPPMG